MIYKDRIITHLQRKIPVITYELTDSTNDRARSFLAETPCERIAFIANGQTNGRGRMGRSFYSPADTGIYLTYAFRSKKTCNDFIRVTTAASVAVAKALDCNAKIKWVNDLYLHGKKICGILTETLSTEEDIYILVGVGINLTTIDFPDSIKQTAGSIHGEIDKEKTIAAICDQLSMVADNIRSDAYLEYYREHMLGVGQDIVYVENRQEHQAVIEGVDHYGGLIVIENNTKKILRSGEISVKGVLE